MRPITFRDLPGFIDPLSAAVEVSVSEVDKQTRELADDDFTRLVLSRITLPSDVRVVAPNTAVHFFADTEPCETANMVLGYGPAGNISCVALREGRQLIFQQLPSEVTGEAETSCCVRVPFENVKAAELFQQFLVLAANKRAAATLDTLHKLMQYTTAPPSVFATDRPAMINDLELSDG